MGCRQLFKLVSLQALGNHRGIQHARSLLRDVSDCMAETLLNHPVVSAHQWLIRCLSPPPAQYFSGFSRSKRGLSPIFIAVFRRLRKEEEEEEAANNISGAESETMTTAEKKMLFCQPTSLLFSLKAASFLGQ